MAEVEAMEGILGKIGELFQKFFAKVASVFSWILDSLLAETAAVALAGLILRLERR